MSTVVTKKLESKIIKQISNVCFGEFSNSIYKNITFVDANVTRDLSFATIFYLVAGPNYNKKKVQEQLEKDAKRIKFLLANVLNLRKMPDLIFKYDETYDNYNKIEELLKSVKNNENK